MFKRKLSGIFEQYKHFGNLVWVIKALKGKHRTACLCYKCSKFNPLKRELNCSKANIIYSLCVEFKMVLPVWECPDFDEKTDLFVNKKKWNFLGKKALKAANDQSSKKLKPMKETFIEIALEKERNTKK